ncbi:MULTISPECIES: hypothetical protein [unclassified Thiocapsa]|uniref:hypothetical protein n=1 Tax=unclassified Thiocapsa TaxID=2641286 RepID=UPI0035AE3FA6
MRFVSDHFEEVVPDVSDKSLRTLADTFIRALIDHWRIPELWPPLLAARDQLLQEYFTANAMRQRIAADQLSADQLWPTEHWWRRSGWEEAAVLLAGLNSDDCTPVIRWLKDHQPEVAAQCILESGAALADRDALYRDLHDAWLPRLTDIELNEYANPVRVGPEGPGPRVVRGGSWHDHPGLARAAGGDNRPPASRDYQIGFRVVCASPIR